MTRPSPVNVAFARLLQHYATCRTLACHSPSAEAAKAGTLADQEAIIAQVLEDRGMGADYVLDVTRAVGYYLSRRTH